jgi:hypothetical protein
MGGGMAAERAAESEDFWDPFADAVAAFDFATFDCVVAGDFLPFEADVLAMRASN